MNVAKFFSLSFAKLSFILLFTKILSIDDRKDGISSGQRFTILDSIKLSNSNQRIFGINWLRFFQMSMFKNITSTSNFRFGNQSHVSPTILNSLPDIQFARFHEVEVAFPRQGETVPPRFDYPPQLCTTWIQIRVAINNTYIPPFHRVKFTYSHNNLNHLEPISIVLNNTMEEIGTTVLANNLCKVSKQLAIKEGKTSISQQ